MFAYLCNSLVHGYILFVLIITIQLPIIFSVCGKMNTLSTCDSNDDKIAAFISVLACSKDEAVFFLDSAAWSVEEVCIYIYTSDLIYLWIYMFYTFLCTCIWPYILFRYVDISVHFFMRMCMSMFSWLRSLVCWGD